MSWSHCHGCPYLRYRWCPSNRLHVPSISGIRSRCSSHCQRHWNSVVLLRWSLSSLVFFLLSFSCSSRYFFVWGGGGRGNVPVIVKTIQIYNIIVINEQESSRCMFLYLQNLKVVGLMKFPFLVCFLTLFYKVVRSVTISRNFAAYSSYSRLVI